MSDVLFAFALFALSGLFRAGFASREYHGEQRSRFRRWLRGSNWFYGGTVRGYNQSLPWTCDFKHLCIFLQIWSLTAAAWLIGSQSGVWLVVEILELFIGINIEGWSFTLFFHYVFTTEPDGNLKHYFLRVLRPWK